MSPMFEPMVLKRKAVVLVVSKLWIVLGAHFENNFDGNFYRVLYQFLRNLFFFWWTINDLLFLFIIQFASGEISNSTKILGYWENKFYITKAKFNVTSMIWFCHLVKVTNDILSAEITNSCSYNVKSSKACFDHINFTWMDNRLGCWRRRCWRWCRPGPAAWQSSPSGSWRPGTHPENRYQEDKRCHPWLSDNQKAPIKEIILCSSVPVLCGQAHFKF